MSHIYISFKIMIGYYSLCLGFVISTHMIGVTQNNVEIVAFTSWLTIVGFVANFGDGFGFINRINIANVSGKESAKNTKNLEYFYLFL